MNLAHILTFIESANLLNFSKVAEKLGISATALGKQIKVLERDVGAQLFYRTTRHVELTEFGHAFLQQCQNIAKSVESTQELIDNYKGEVSGTLKVVSSIAFGETYITPNIKQFLSQHPKLTLELELIDEVVDIEEQAIDVLIGMIASRQQHVMQQRLMDVTYCWCASPEYLAKKGDAKSVKDLMKYDWISHSKRPKNAEWLLPNDVSMPAPPKLSTNNTCSMIQACLDGLGIACFHKYTINHYLKQGKLKELFPEELLKKETLYIYFRKMQYTQPKVRAFIDFFAKKDYPSVG